MVLSDLHSLDHLVWETFCSKQDLSRLDSSLTAIQQLSYDRDSISQEDLDLTNKGRTSLLPWRGQFSPELIELLLNKYSQDSVAVLDPFLGSGTTMFESIRKGLKCYGSEINPSAVEMSKTAYFANISLSARKEIIQETIRLVENFFRAPTRDLFSYQEEQNQENQFEESCRIIMEKTINNPLVRNIFINALIRYMNGKGPLTNLSFFQAINEHGRIIERLPSSLQECQVFHADARSIPLPDNSIDLVITSPPYINVFNYHQNNRPAMELLGWNLLDIAKSEIGANRKHRQNRFFTVIQYSLDMLDVLHEIRRLLKADGLALLIVGRESTVRGISFNNGSLVAALAQGASFSLDNLQERKFVNKFGETLYEDIFHLIPNPKEEIVNDSFARSVAVWHLQQNIGVADEPINCEMRQAIESAATVKKSPLLKAL